MLTKTSLAAVALLASSVSCIPNNVQPRQTTDSSLEPWVTVGDDGKPKTVTPVLTTISGTPTVISGAPAQLTGTVFTETNYGQVTTSTGTAPIATATNTDGAGSFLVCSNKDGENAPWCAPSPGENLYPGTTYYFRWDPKYFSSSNTTVMVQGNYVNATTGDVTTQAFESAMMAASWGFWSHTIDSGLMQGTSGMNISLQIAALAHDGSASTIVKGPTVLVTNLPTYKPVQPKIPTGPALYIGLPTVAGFVILVIAGTCIWNRSKRRIGLGNVMSRSRHGYGVGKSSRSRMRLGGKKKMAAERIQLMERELQAEGGQVYRDVPDRIEIPRRGSDALGSLVGTPTEERRMDFHRPGTREGRERAGGERNFLREEMSWQDGQVRF